MTEKHKANAVLVEFAKNFIGIKKNILDLVGKSVLKVYEVPNTKITIIIFSDNTFIFYNPQILEPKDIILSLKHLYQIQILSEHEISKIELPYDKEFAKFQELIKNDEDLTKQARTENILGAIKNNINQIPELHALIPELLYKINNGEIESCKI